VTSPNAASETSRWDPVRVFARRWWRSYQWWVVGGAALLATALGFVGFSAYLGADTRTSWDLLYLSLQLFILQSGDVIGPAPPALEIARWLAPAVAAYTVVGVVATVFRDELTGLRSRFRRDHVIVCGLEAGWALARMLQADNERIVVIEGNPAHPRVESCRSAHIPVLVGDARDEQVLRRAGIRRAARLFTVCGDDRVNMRVAEQARRLSAERRDLRIRRMPRPLGVVAHIADPYLAGLLTMQEMSHPGPHDGRLDFFNLYAGGARALLAQFPLQGDVGGLSRAPHMLVVGLGRLGCQLVVRAARNWGAEAHPTGERLWITVADDDALEAVSRLRARHPFLGESCELRLIDQPPDPPRILRAIASGVPGCPPVSSVFVCLPDDADGLAVGLALHAALRERGIPVVVRTYDADVAALVQDSPEPGGGGLYVVDQIERTCRPDELFAGETESLAREIHEVYRRQRGAAGESEANNHSMVEWQHLPEEKKRSNLEQAEHVRAKLEAVGCRIGPLSDPAAELFVFAEDEVERLAQMEHERWMAEADPDHPARVIWEHLSEPMKEIDRNFVRRLPVLLTTAGLQIDRTGSTATDRHESPSEVGAH
jgi:hypothetical protein